MTFRDLCTKEIVQLQNGVCLGKADDLEFDPQTAEITSLQLAWDSPGCSGLWAGRKR